MEAVIGATFLIPLFMAFLSMVGTVLVIGFIIWLIVKKPNNENYNTQNTTVNRQREYDEYEEDEYAI